MREKLTGIQNRHREYLEEKENYEHNKEKTDEEIEEPVEFKEELPDYALFCTDPREVWMYFGDGLFIPQLIENDMKWKTYHCFDYEFPTEEELNHLKGIVIPGNTDNVHDDIDYLKKTRVIILKIYEEHENVRLVGSCFGHQIITIALGGEVEHINADVPLILGKIPTKITKEMKCLKEFKNSFGKDFQKEEICILRSHGWIVTKPPPEAIILGTCEYGDNDILLIPERVLSLQAHPELSDNFILNTIIKRVHANKVTFMGLLSVDN